MNRILSIFLILLLPALGWCQQKYWVFFRDKGLSVTTRAEALENVKATLSQKTLMRRAKVLPEYKLVDETDLPLNSNYLTELRQLGVKPVVKSRWLNAISAKLNDDQLAQIRQLPFVDKITPVSRFRRKQPEIPSEPLLLKPQAHQLDYGYSLTQNNLMKVPDVHDLGLNASHVIVGMLDTGFNYQFHEAFQNLTVLGEYDFINGDSITYNEFEDVSSQHNHGTSTLSAIAGFKEGQLIGPAFGASFYLAKTEDVSNEYQQEEDFWVAGLEWMEHQGVEVVNSSLGYLDWYTYQDMDGETAVTTRAANLAVKKGVVVVNSMGNEGNNTWYYMIAPADANGVISVGAVDSNGELAGFSSHGPTYDGRTKPDVVAMGRAVYTVDPSSLNQYKSVSGTSLSSPLTAGVAALILEAHPYLKPAQVKEALRETADRAREPDNDYGWGLVNAYEAIFYHGLFFSRMPTVRHDERMGHQVKIKIYSKYELIADSLFVYYAVGGTNFSRLHLFPSTEAYEYRAWLPLQAKGTEVKIYFSAIDSSGDHKFHPYRSPQTYFTFIAFDSTMSEFEPLPEDFILYQNYPNPFKTTTSIEYDILSPGEVNITIYNIRGQKVRTLINEYHAMDRYRASWDGSDDRGKHVPAGIYFYRMKTGNISLVKRLVFLGREKS